LGLVSGRGTIMLARWTIAASAACALLGCATAADDTQEAYRPTGLVAIGDAGYHYDYITQRSQDRAPRTPDAFIAHERENWIEDRRPPAEFEAPPMHQLANGGYVAASGMMPVANAVRRYCETAACDAGVVLGDNIYPDGATLGADGHDDSQRFADIFEAPYGWMRSLGEAFRMYVALGNHDWHTSREGAMAQAAYHSQHPPFFMDGLIYSVRPTGHEDVEIFVLDTQVLLAGETVYTDVLAEDGSEVESTTVEELEAWAAPQTALERNMVAWLDERLRASTARWRIVVAHHPLWSSAGGKFQQARVLRRLLLPTLCRNADMFVAGHEHTMEVHTDACTAFAPDLPPLLTVVSGAASKQRPLNSNFMAHQLRNNRDLRTLFARGMEWGFAHIQLGADAARVEIVTTPDDGSGVPVLAYTQSFPRRTARR
jgi:tartrate-resistant acid phosphatase type 5